ncbi:hypothetical protein BN1013_01150 [Candidatus Rubidus massiliensis]|nr:MAG: hypothetical protein BGO10_01490 [Chlamydia sp. 32-24]CDZ80633.1 hypothetical protein BN1013_01150 [Candidatus Rubidus massiliensis]
MNNINSQFIQSNTVKFLTCMPIIGTVVNLFVEKKLKQIVSQQQDVKREHLQDRSITSLNLKKALEDYRTTQIIRGVLGLAIFLTLITTTFIFYIEALILSQLIYGTIFLISQLVEREGQIAKFFEKR